MTINEFLIWLASASGAGVAASFILQRMAWFKGQSSDAKGYITLGASVVLALLAYGYMTLVPAEAQATLTPWIQIIYGVAGAWIANQIGHTLDPQNKPGPEHAAKG